MGYNRKRRPSNDRARKEHLDSIDFKEKSDRLFAEDMDTRIQYFMNSDEKELEFEPMNSYKRRLIHQISQPYNLKTESRGDEPVRRVCLIKQSESKAPKNNKAPKLWDFGMQTYPVNPGAEGIRLALKMDGSVEIWQEKDRHQVLDEKLVTAKQIRIRSGKILEPGDQGW